MYNKLQSSDWKLDGVRNEVQQQVVDSVRCFQRQPVPGLHHAQGVLVPRHKPAQQQFEDLTSCLPLLTVHCTASQALHMEPPSQPYLAEACILHAQAIEVRFDNFVMRQQQVDAKPVQIPHNLSDSPFFRGVCVCVANDAQSGNRNVWDCLSRACRLWNIELLGGHASHRVAVPIESCKHHELPSAMLDKRL